MPAPLPEPPPLPEPAPPPARPSQVAGTVRVPLAIVGAGALGLHFAARLAAVVPVALIARDADGAARLRAGVAVGGEPFRPQAFAAEQAPQADWVIVLVKAGDTAAAAVTAARMHPLGVLSLQNGLTMDLLRAHCDAPQVEQGITTEGAYRDEAGVHPSGAGETLVPPGFEPVAAMLAAAGLRTRVEAAIGAARLAKLLVNVAINPLAALHRVPNGALLDAPLRAQLDALVREAWPVLRVEGLALDEGEALARVHTVAQATATNRASMLQDVLAGRRTEIDAITGALLAMAARQQRSLPLHEALFRQLRTLEASGRNSPHFG